MANEEQVEILKQGGDTWNAWRKDNPNVKVDLRQANLRQANLMGSNLSGADLMGSNLSGANLNGADLMGSNLSGANLSGAYLGEADLIGARLKKARLIGARLKKARLIKANLSEADLSKADLSEADLSKADLSEADLSKADLSEADLMRASLQGANLMSADLQEANLGEAISYITQFMDVDLSEVEGLGQIIHAGRSSIGLDTIRLSKGKLPVEFLRGCGLTDLQIATVQLQNPDLPRDEFINLTYKLDEIRNAGAIAFHSCFISYTEQDRPIAERLYHDLQNSGVRCWYAPAKMKTGDKIRLEIDRAVSTYEKLLLILSKDSVESQWVEDEVASAMEKEEENKVTMLFPIRLDDEVMKIKSGWPAAIRRTRHIGDFRKWEDENEYRIVFEKLKKDLISEEDPSNKLRHF